MFGKFVAGENPGQDCPQEDSLTCLADDLEGFGATEGSIDDNRTMSGKPPVNYSRPEGEGNTIVTVHPVVFGSG